jgi:hypothetical protein
MVALIVTVTMEAVGLRIVGGATQYAIFAEVTKEYA